MLAANRLKGQRGMFSHAEISCNALVQRHLGQVDMNNPPHLSAMWHKDTVSCPWLVWTSEWVIQAASETGCKSFCETALVCFQCQKAKHQASTSLPNGSLNLFYGFFFFFCGGVRGGTTQRRESKFGRRANNFPVMPQSVGSFPMLFWRPALFVWWGSLLAKRWPVCPCVCVCLLVIANWTNHSLCVVSLCEGETAIAIIRSHPLPDTELPSRPAGCRLPMSLSVPQPLSVSFASRLLTLSPPRSAVARDQAWLVER